MKNPTKALLSSLTVLLLVLTGCSGGEASDLSPEQPNIKVLPKDKADEQLNSYFESGMVQYREVKHEPDYYSWQNEVDSTAADLPEVTNYPLSVTGSGDLVVEIASSTEKSNKEASGWLDRMAKEFNASGAMVNGRPVAVSVRPMASGLALGYITSKKYVPDAYSPANELWIPMIEDSGVSVQQVEDRLVGNTAGILMKDATYESFIEKYGEVTIANVVKAALAGDLVLGHTDPNLSSTGLNMLLEELKSMDSKNLLSDKAVATYREFQKTVPGTSMTTAEMKEVAKRNLADAMIMESQTFTATPELATGWTFTPAGVRHDSPLYALNNLPSDEVQVLEQFAAFTQSMEAQKLGSSLGFNLHDEYKGVANTLTGAQISGALDIWKVNKDGGVPLVTMIVVDSSGSMEDNDKIEQAQQALLSGAGEINPFSYVGMISYGSDIRVDMPIAAFSDEQRSVFVSAVNALEPAGQTHTNSALVVALKMMKEFEKKLQEDATLKNEPLQEVKYRIVLVSDGAQQGGLELDQALQLLASFEVPVYCISFETGTVLKDMNTLSAVGRESASVTIATSEDVRTVFKNVARNAL